MDDIQSKLLLGPTIHVGSHVLWLVKKGLSTKIHRGRLGFIIYRVQNLYSYHPSPAARYLAGVASLIVDDNPGDVQLLPRFTL
jgi:hypothetical protein